jgi:hypothetical protein
MLIIEFQQLSNSMQHLFNIWDTSLKYGKKTKNSEAYEDYNIPLSFQAILHDFLFQQLLPS